mmetsp:Transcript_113781/g.317800  ORF Transcript_113781/g.317800 Transcript_113781/m.317800 type:complete len:309 (+) Transcript_113781:116-1042(+)
MTAMVASLFSRPAAKLTSGSQVAYRSSVHMKKVESVRIHYDGKRSAMVVEIPDYPEHIIPVAEITRQRMYDYAEGAANVWGLVLSTAEAAIQHSFIFDSQEERDFWDSQLGSFRRSAAPSQPAMAVPAAYRSVKQIQITTPQATARTQHGQVALSLRLELAPLIGKDGAMSEDLVIYEAKDMLSAMKRQVDEFVDANKVLPTEGTPLYRLVKALRQRQEVLRETQNMIQEIQAQHLGAHCTDGGPVPEGQAAKAGEALLRLERQLAEGLGAQGVGAQLVQKILTRNIAKLRTINDVVAKMQRLKSAPP